MCMRPRNLQRAFVFSDVSQQVKTCMDLLSTACEGNALYPTLVQAIQKGEQACSQKGKEMHYTQLSSSLLRQ